MLVRAGQEARVVAQHPVPAGDDVRPDDLVQRVQARLAVGVGDRGGQVVAASVRHGTAMVAATAPRTSRARRGAVDLRQGVLEGLLGLLVERRLADAPVVLAQRRDEQADVAVLDEQEQRRAAGRQVVADLLDEAAVHAGRHRPADEAADDRAADDPGDREDEEQHRAEDAADDGARSPCRSRPRS